MPSTWPANIPKSGFKEAILNCLDSGCDKKGQGPPKCGALLLQEGADGHLPDGCQPHLTNCNICTLNSTSEDGPDTDCRSLPTAPGHTAAPQARAFRKMQNDKPEKRLWLIQVCSRAQLKESSKVDAREKAILNIYILNVSPIQRFVPNHKHALLSTCHLANLELRCEPCKPSQPWRFCFQVTPQLKTSSFFSFQTKSL